MQAMGPHFRPGLGLAFWSCGFVFFLLTALAFNAVVSYLLWECYRRIPKRFRQMEPALVWLLLVPVFNLFWNFVVFPRLSASYKAYFDSVGGRDLGNASHSVAMAYSISAACKVAPCIAPAAFLAQLVLLVLYLVDAHKLNRQIAAA